MCSKTYTLSQGPIYTMERLLWYVFCQESVKMMLKWWKEEQYPFALSVSRTLPAPLYHLLGKLSPRGNLILGHKHPGGCGKTKFAKKWKSVLGVEWWKPEERCSIVQCTGVTWKGIVIGMDSRDKERKNIHWGEFKLINWSQTKREDWAGERDGGRRVKLLSPTPGRVNSRKSQL